MSKGKLSDLTFSEARMLSRLADAPLVGRDSTSERVLVNKGFARRVDFGMIEITPAGRTALQDHGESR